ncbi:O-antigen polymerase [Pseudoalteromonas sp. Ld20]|uniref:O-antigen polymerase n=1 Tax=Pseudoalteromonas sp. Ld20 TaxID=649165 RepID=UPI003870797D
MSLKKGKIWPLLFYKEILLILLPMVLISLYGVSFFKSSLFYANNESIPYTNLLILFNVVFFLLCLAISSRFFIVSKISYNTIDIEKNAMIFLVSAMLLGIIILVFSLLFLGYKHAFISTILSGENLLVARISNKYSTSLPSQFMRLITISFWMSSVLAGVYYYSKKTRLAFVCLLVSLFLASADGGKAPIVISIVLFVSTVLYLSKDRINFKKYLAFSPFYFLFIFSFIYYITSLQLSNLSFTSFIEYLVNRIGVGQMSGVYETFAIPELKGDYYLHSIPFASYFFEYPTYDKDLMVYVENLDPSKTGVKNSFFLSESFGAFGWFGAFIFPFWIGIVYPINYYLIHKFLSTFASHQVAMLIAQPFFFMSFSLNGGVSSLLLFKGLIFNLILLTIFILNFYLFKIVRGFIFK